jgi:carbamoyltransferase
VGAAKPWVLGISASHNGAYCLLHGDEVVVAVQEERLTGLKRQRIYGASPALGLTYCLEHAGIGVRDLSMVVSCMQGTADDPAQDVALNPALRTAFHGIPTRRIPHHLGHAVSALAMSGLDRAAVLVVDGIGSGEDEFDDAERGVCLQPTVLGRETISLYAGNGVQITPLEKHLVDRGQWLGPSTQGLPTFGSLGGMFSAAAQLIFGDRMEAGKVMGLAPYGTPDLPASAFFTIADRRFVFRDELCSRYAGFERWPMHQEAYCTLAASVQHALEEALLYLTRHLRELSGMDALCYTGGVALNSVANERIHREAGYRHVYIPPAAEDSGPAIGAAYHGLWELTKTNTHRRLVHDSVGCRYTDAQLTAAIATTPCVREIAATDAIDATVDRVMQGQIGGWFHGRSELGPRALGQRSILCDPRRPDGKEVLNRRVKHREGFRPFAPAVLLEEVEHWFNLDGAEPDSPFMLRVCNFKPERRGEVPAVVHCDGTGRVQTVTRQNNGRFYDLIRGFFARTGVPILLNTSYNIMGEPIIETPADALWDLLFTGLDFCVLENHLVERMPGYQSPLDLIPVLRATQCTITMPLVAGRLDLSVPTGGSIPFLVETPWGPNEQQISPDILPLFERIDGIATGRALLAQLIADGHALTEQELTSTLLRLRRRHLLGFREAARP